MFIKLTPVTTPAQAIQMAYEFASALRATGWPAEDIGYARALWIGAEYASSHVLTYLDAGFTAGYLGEHMPRPADVPATPSYPDPAEDGVVVSPSGDIGGTGAPKKARETKGPVRSFHS